MIQKLDRVEVINPDDPRFGRQGTVTGFYEYGYRVAVVFDGLGEIPYNEVELKKIKSS